MQESIKNQTNASTKVVKKPIKSWYQDKIFAVKIQRNILLIINIILFLAVLSSLVVIKSIVEKNSVEPYVIKVSKQDQIPVSIGIESIRNYASANQGVLEYFLIEYIRARESYNFETYMHDYSTFVRRMSTPSVFRPFWDMVNDPTNGLLSSLGKNSKVDIVIKQIALESKNNIVVIRIAKRLMSSGNIRQISHFKIKMHYFFDTSNLTYRDIVLNPLGLKIDFYEVVEEKALVNDEVFNKIL